MIRKYLPDALWLMALSAYILIGTSLVPFHGDESTQIYMSRDYAYQFMQHNLDLVTYHEPAISPTEQELRLLNGPINKYLNGLAWHLGGFSLDDINEQWDWGADWDYNQRSGHIPTLELLRVTRWPSAILLAGGMIALFMLGWLVGQRPVAYLASLYYALNPTLLINGRRAMMESGLLFFGLLVLLAAIWFLRQPSWRTTLLLGISGGLAIASKHTALFAVLTIFGGCLIYSVVQFIRQSRITAKDENHLSRTNLAASIGRLFAAGVLTLLVFYVLNPVWWGDPISRVSTVLQLREDLLETQVAVFGGYADMGDQAAGFARQAFINNPQYYETAGWQQPLADQITTYEASPWGGISIGGSVVGGLILALLCMAGGWFLLRDSTISPETRWLIGLWALAMVGTTLLLTPLEWQRYYLPVYPVIGLLAALGLTRIFGTVRHLWFTG